MADEENKAIESKTNRRIEGAVKTGVRLIPYVGGAIAGAYADYRANQQAEKVDRFFEEVQARCSKLEDRLDRQEVLDYITHDEFLCLFEEAIQKYMATSDPVKQDYLIGLIVSSMVGTGNHPEREFFLRKISDMSSIHLDLLRLYYSPERAFPMKGIQPESLSGRQYSSVVAAYFPGVDFNIVKAAHNDLYNSKFINTDNNIFGTMMLATGVDAIKGRVTPIGAKFVEICLPFE